MCCFNGDQSNCTSLSSGICPYTCLERNISACGVEFSTGKQAAFCEILHTPSWPPILQVSLQSASVTSCAAHCDSAVDLLLPVLAVYALWINDAIDTVLNDAVLQTPAEEDRADPFKPKVAFLYTGQNPDLAKDLTQGLVSKPDFGPLELLAAQKYLTAFNSDLQHSPTAVPGELLSLLGFRLGTSSSIQAGLYVEPALVGVSP